MRWWPAAACDAAAQAAAKLPGVAKVLTADAPALDHLLAEPLAALLVALAPDYDAPAGRDDGGGQEHHAARRRAAGRAADQRHRRRGGCRHVHPPDLRRQRHGDGEVVRREEGDHRARRELRSGGGGGRQRADRGGAPAVELPACRASSRPSCPRASGRN